ncbi:hypothetical protein LZ554_004236 [Drepanopeziza brunnea f. sp. 'monogermtubi']|nr:hypothetical protein LZ554_004236 [Drepanopeziza brunnea f. sp. 'monogermtubi']
MQPTRSILFLCSASVFASASVLGQPDQEPQSRHLQLRLSRSFAAKSIHHHHPPKPDATEKITESELHVH